MKNKILPLLCLIALSVLPARNALAQGTAFTYQGQLNVGGSPASGLYDFRFRLAADTLANNYVGAAYLTNGVSVVNGLFIATIDFGAVFTGSNYWLEVDVRTNGAGTYTALNPLQPLTPVPNAIFAATASNLLGGVTVAELGGAATNASVPGTVVVRDNTGSFSAGSVSITNIVFPASNAAVVAGTTPILRFSSSPVNFFAGPNSGNLTMTGGNNFGLGGSVLSANTSGGQNTGMGGAALGNNTQGGQNTAFGNSSLTANTTASGNTAVGFASLYQNTAAQNTAVGYESLENNTSGTQNTALGSRALLSNVSGANNTAVGFTALNSNTGNQNTAVGNVSLFSNTTGTENTAAGDGSLYHNTSGSYNTANGWWALFNASTGQQNTAVGWEALANLTTGTNNTGLGFSSGNNVTTGNNNIEIGNPGVSGDNGIIRIGTVGQQTNAYVAGINGVGVTNAAIVLVSTTGQLGSMPLGLTTNFAVLVPGGGTNTLVFTNGILKAIQ